MNKYLHNDAESIRLREIIAAGFATAREEAKP